MSNPKDLTIFDEFYPCNMKQILLDLATANNQPSEYMIDREPLPITTLPFSNIFNCSFHLLPSLKRRSVLSFLASQNSSID